MPKSHSSALPPLPAYRPVSAPRPRASCPPKTSPSTCSPPAKPPASSLTSPPPKRSLKPTQHHNRDSQPFSQSIQNRQSLLRLWESYCEPCAHHVIQRTLHFFQALGTFLANENDRIDELRLTIFDNGFQEFILQARINSCSSEQCSLKNIRPQEKIHHKISDIFMFQKTNCIVTKSISR